MRQPVNINYCASVVEISKLIPIEKADKIQIALIHGNSVVVSKDIEIGTKGLFFPLECQLRDNFLSKHNLFRDSTKNVNPEKAGFFEANGRIRAVSLRGQKSEGFFIPLSGLHEDYAEITKFDIGTDFDYLGNECICRKYAVKVVNKQNTQKQKKAVNKFSRLVDNQFNLHIDTIQAKKNFHLINPADIISITDKWHGTSAVFANVLTNRKLKWYEKLLLKLGVKIDSVEYGNVYSSRKVIKNKYINEESGEGFYQSDIWGIVNEELKQILPKGISVYGEIVGFIPGSNKAIQGGYSYGCQINTYKFLVYRVTNTTFDGHVTEYSWQQIKDFCAKYGLNHVKEFYYGYAKDLYPHVPLDDNWNDTVLSLLVSDFNLETECKYNKGMPAEGIVIRKDDLYDCRPMKLKSFAFLQHETKLLDDGADDIESNQEDLYQAA
jgi:hypothetical protein